MRPSLLTSWPRLEPNVDKRDIRALIPLPVRQPALRQSTLKDLATCERYFLFRHVLGLALGRYEQAPHMGKVLHLCLNGYWQGLSPEDVRARVRIAVTDYENRVREWGSKSTTPEGTAKLLEKFHRDTTIAQTMAEVMWERFPKSKFEQALNCTFEVVDLEEEFSYEHPEYGTVGGRLDVVLRVVDSPNPDMVGAYVVLDFKTSTDPGSYLLTSRFAVQPLLYCSLLLRKFPGARVLGFIHVVMAKPLYDAYADSVDRMRDWVDGRDDEVGTGEVFKSGPRKGLPKPRWEHGSEAASRVLEPVLDGVFTRLEGDPEARLQGWFKRFWVATRRDPIVDLFDTTGQAAGHCTKLFGKPCPYLRLCGSHEWNWAGLVRDHYHVVDTESDTEDLMEIEPWQR